MPNTHPVATRPLAEPKPEQPSRGLEALRGELDRLDDAMHDLLMRRAEVVARIGALGTKGKVALRPGREAQIVRRLLGRHRGRLPRAALARLWRELFAATTSMQGAYVITVGETDPAGAAMVQCAREHFGVLTPLRVHQSPSDVIADVAAGRATAGVLPLPQSDESPASAWWVGLLRRASPRPGPRLHVVARLPFWSPRPEGSPDRPALVVAAIEPDPSGGDRSLIGLELPIVVSLADLSVALTAATLVPSMTILHRDEAAETTYGLLEVDGYVTEADPRLAGLGDLARGLRVLGAYAVPVDGV